MQAKKRQNNIYYAEITSAVIYNFFISLIDPLTYNLSSLINLAISLMQAKEQQNNAFLDVVIYNFGLGV